MSEPAKAEEVVATFSEMSLAQIWGENWQQNEVHPGAWTVDGTSTHIQGVMCCIDLDNSCHWLLMLVDDGKVSFLATTYGNPTYSWMWIHADSNAHAISQFVNWVEVGEEMKAINQ